MFLQIVGIIAGIVFAVLTASVEDTWKKVVLGVCAVTMVGASVASIMEQNREKAAEAKTGILIGPKDRPVITVEIGRSGSMFTCFVDDDSIFDLGDFHRRFGSSQVWLEAIGNEAKLSAKLRDSEGKLIAVLDKNVWQVNPNNYFDRNFTHDAIEIVDNTGRVVLQVEMLTDRVRFQGILYNESGIGFGFVQAPGGGAFLMPLPPDKEKREAMINAHPIGRLFKYPSETHLGERLEQAQ
jgi:hypothetical protein